MRKHIHNVRDLILPLIDFFYPPFRKLMNLQTFRYAASGGANMVLGLVVYYVSFRWILHGEMLDLGFTALKGHSAALFMSFCVSFPVGFFLMKYVVFTESNIKSRVQLFRYFMIFSFNLVLNYLLLKICVEDLYIYPPLAQTMTTGVVVVFSYFATRHFSFKTAQSEGTEEEVTD